MNRISRFRLLAVTVMVLALFTGCAKTSGTSTVAPPIHAGAANAFDSSVYDALVTVQAAIEAAKPGIPAGKKALLNQIIADYNVAEKAYVNYHNLAIAGTATPAQQTALQAQVDSLKTKLGGLQ